MIPGYLFMVAGAAAAWITMTAFAIEIMIRWPDTVLARWCAFYALRLQIASVLAGALAGDLIFIWLRWEETK